jgi:glycerol-3-phosphate dehydrogenase
MHRIVSGPPLGPPGVISILGGKITGYRAIAEDATDAVCRRLGARDRRATTAEAPLPGGAGGGSTLPAHLFDLYGSRASAILALAETDPELRRPLADGYPDIAAQVVYSVRSEHCVKLSDFLRRRTLLGASADQGLDAAAPAAAVMSRELSWTPARTSEEIESYRREVAATRQFREG